MGVLLHWCKTQPEKRSLDHEYYTAPTRQQDELDHFNLRNLSAMKEWE